MDVVEEQPVPVIHDGVILDCGFRADLVVNRYVVAELKAKTTIHPVGQAQLLSHLRSTLFRVEMLVSFHE